MSQTSRGRPVHGSALVFPLRREGDPATLPSVPVPNGGMAAGDAVKGVDAAMTFGERLAQATASSLLCVGLDPVPHRLPAHLAGEDAVARFCEAIVESTARYAAAFKPNLAFFEALGAVGDAALERVIAAVQEQAPNALLIGDGKRGDIGSTAERYASALYDRWGFDAVTVNPWFGADGVKPFAERPDRGVYLLAATSNPSSAEVQEASNGGEPLYVRIARLAYSSWNEHSNLGLVVGATRVETMEAIREAGADLPWLIPGVGTQGGDAEQAVRFGLATGGMASLINASRSVLYASAGEDFAEAAAAEAKKLHEMIGRARQAV